MMDEAQKQLLVEEMNGYYMPQVVKIISPSGGAVFLRESIEYPEDYASDDVDCVVDSLLFGDVLNEELIKKEKVIVVMGCVIDIGEIVEHIK